MTILCNECKYFENCPNLKENPEIIGCCDFGGFDEDGALVQNAIDGEFHDMEEIKVHE